MTRRIVVGALLLVLVGGLAFGQEAAQAEKDQAERKILISLNPLGPILGIYSGSFEMAVGPRLDFFVAPTFWNIRLSILGGLVPDGFSAWTLGVLGGVNFFPLAPTAPKGLFLGGGASLSYLYVGADGANVSGFVINPLVQVGYRWIWGWFSIAPSFNLGYEIALIDASVLGSAYDLYIPGGVSWGFGLGLAIAL